MSICMMEVMDNSKKISVILNGEKVKIPYGISIVELLSIYKIGPRRVAVELNLNIVENDNYTSTFIKDGDKLEIIGFVGGGAR